MILPWYFNLMKLGIDFAKHLFLFMLSKGIKARLQKALSNPHFTLTKEY